MIRWLFVILLILGVHAALVYGGFTPILHGDMPDSDTYMRLVRVEAWVNGQSWFDSTVDRMNAPYGDVLNWTRPLDVLIVAGAYPLHVWQGMDWHTALFWSGAALPVVLHLLLGLAIVWAFAPLMPRAIGPLLFVVALLQPVMLAYNMAGRPDHQTLLLICAALMFGGLVREQAGAHRPLRCAIEAGLWAGFGIWVSTEYQFLVIVVTGMLALLWLKTGEDRHLRALEGLALGLFAMTGLAVLAERGADWARVRELDKVSLSQLLAAAVNCGVWGFVVGLGRDRGFGRRLAVLVGFGLLGLLGLLFFAPEILRGPTGDVDPRVLREFLLANREMSPLVPISGVTLLWLGTPLLALPLWLGLQKNRLPLVWLPLVWSVAFFTGAGLLHARFAQWAAPLGAVLLVEVFRLMPVARASLRVLLAVGLLAGPVLAGLVWINENPQQPRDNPRCELADLAPFLNQQPQGILMGSLNVGPEILYRTHHAVVSGPYHRNRDGILDSFDFFATGDRAILNRRGVRYVLVCKGDKGAFAQKLVDGTAPGWLKPITLPPETDFRLYATD